jgi:DNA-3-methyladenine glycosylase
VVEASIAANQVALLGLTGSSVIGVFQTLSAGKAGQFVPGIVVPGARSEGCSPAEADKGVIRSTNPATAASLVPLQTGLRGEVSIVVVRCAARHFALTSGAYHREFLVSSVAETSHNGSMGTRLPRTFFARAPEIVARELIGCVMTVTHPDRTFRAMIVETEAYDGANDPASHAYRGPTPRTEIMFGPAGHVYVYRSYGIHWCMNIVSGVPGTASAVLLRGAEFLVEEENAQTNMHGPGLLTRVLGVTGDDNGEDVCRRPPGKFSISSAPQGEALLIGRSTRIGISKAQDRLWRFFKE